MDKREFDIKIKAMLNFNKKIHTKDGATVENFKKLNYLIIEMGNKGCKIEEVLSSLCTGKHANKEKFDLLCRVTEQFRYPTLVYTPDIKYTDDLSTIKNSAMDESRVRSSKWMKTIASVANVSEDELYRFTQCYMLLEQFGREEFVITETLGRVDKIKYGYICTAICSGYHNQEIEIDKKFEVISKLMCCKLEDYHKIQSIINNRGCKNIEEHQLLLAAYNSADSFFALKSRFDSLNIRGAQGDTGVHIFKRYSLGLPTTINEYPGACSMVEAASAAESRCAANFAKLSVYVNPSLYDFETSDGEDDDVM